jgi:stress-induced morphogen
LHRFQFRQLPSQACWLSSASPATEEQLEYKLKQGLQANHVRVVDTSGGCGTMYQIEVVAEAFRGKSKVQQQQLVTKLLKEDIKTWHGFVMDTRTP